MAVAFQAHWLRLKGSLYPEFFEFFREFCPESARFVRRISDRLRNHTSTERQNMSKLEKKQAASIVWFEIPADDPERAKSFYSNLFGWKINPFPGGGDYWYIDTGGADDTPDGALKKRKQPQEPVVNYLSVNSVAEFSKKIEKLGGKICMAKTAVPQMGYFAVCQDTEGNPLGIWQSDPDAK
jgi:predicted enzyme related to lactoylglutathione lyase